MTQVNNLRQIVALLMGSPVGACIRPREPADDYQRSQSAGTVLVQEQEEVELMDEVLADRAFEIGLGYERM